MKKVLGRSAVKPRKYSPENVLSRRGLIRWNNGGADARGSHVWGPSLIHAGPRGKRSATDWRDPRPAGRALCRRLLLLARPRGRGRTPASGGDCRRHRGPPSTLRLWMDSTLNSASNQGLCARRGGRGRAEHGLRRRWLREEMGLATTMVPARGKGHGHGRRSEWISLVVEGAREGLGLGRIEGGKRRWPRPRWRVESAPGARASG